MNNTIVCCGKDPNSKHKCVRYNKSTKLKNLSLLYDPSSLMMWLEYLKKNGNEVWGCRAMENVYKLWLKRLPAIEAKRKIKKQMLEETLRQEEQKRQKEEYELKRKLMEEEEERERKIMIEKQIELEFKNEKKKSFKKTER